MKPPDNLAVVFRGATEFVRELRILLDKQRIASWTGPLPTEPQRPPAAWLGVQTADAPRAAAAIDAHHDAMVADERGRKAAAKVADFDAPETECPACGFRFATAGAQRCPDCGLNFGG